MMVECWAREPKERPRMSSAEKQIAEFLVDQSPIGNISYLIKKK
jgi:hypothetical protein